MSETRVTNLRILIAAALVAAASLCAHSGAQPDAPAPVGRLTVAPSDHAARAPLLDVLSRALGLVRTHVEIGGADPFVPGPDAGSGPMHWVVELAPTGAVGLGPAGENPRTVEGFDIDLEVDLNALRAASAQPFAPSTRGRVLEALAVPNARRARYAALVDPEDEEALLLISASESRAQPPGVWRARRLATVRLAPLRAQSGEPVPLLVRFDERWEGVVGALAGAVLAFGPADESRGLEERLTEWGATRRAALRAVTSAFEPSVRLWPGSGAGDLVAACRLARGTSDQAVASHLRTMLGQRIQWSRGGDNRVTGRVALLRESRAASADSPALSLRFVSIDRRSYLVWATNADDLNAAPSVLATLDE